MTSNAPVVQFTVYGTAAPAGSKRAVGGKGGRKVFVIDANPRARPWKDHVAQVAGDYMRELPLLMGAVKATFVFYRKRPKSHFLKSGALKASAPKYPVTKPDVLKLARGVEDALSGIVYHDDAQIVAEPLAKLYGEPERVEITVQEVNG